MTRNYLLTVSMIVAMWTVCMSAQDQKHFQIPIEQKLSVDVTPSISTNDVPVKAGEMFAFTVKVDKAPNFNGGNLIFVISGPSGGGSSYGVQSSIGLIPGQKEYNAKILIPADARGGTWTLTISGISAGTETHAFSGIKPRTFEVIRKYSDLILPTRGEIVVNPSQQQVLRMAARRLQAQIQNLKVAVSEYENKKQHGQIPAVLRENVNAALEALNKTQAEFKSQQTSPQQAEMADVFFGDLRLNYSEVIKDLDQRSVMRSPHIVSVKMPEPSTRYSLVAQAVLRAFDVNELAYNVVADNGSLAFNLKVMSEPTGAAVSYYRRGDSPKRYPEPNYCNHFVLVLCNLVRACGEAGYKSETIEFDPYHSSDLVVNVRLTASK